MIKTSPLQTALIAALLGSVALVGCKKKEESTDNNAAPAALFAPKDDVIVSVRTDAAANNVTVGAKLTFQDGQVAGEQNATLNTSGAETTNITFKNANGWPAGKYRAEVMVDGKAAGTPQEFEVK